MWRKGLRLQDEATPPLGKATPANQASCSLPIPGRENCEEALPGPAWTRPRALLPPALRLTHWESDFQGTTVSHGHTEPAHSEEQPSF